MSSSKNGMLRSPIETSLQYCEPAFLSHLELVGDELRISQKSFLLGELYLHSKYKLKSRSIGTYESYFHSTGENQS